MSVWTPEPAGPAGNPRGLAGPLELTDSRSITLSEGTSLRVILRDPLSSKAIPIRTRPRTSRLSSRLRPTLAWTAFR